MKAKLTHVDEKGRARMVNVGEKPITRRRAVASARVKMQPATLQALRANTLAKGFSGVRIEVIDTLVAISQRDGDVEFHSPRLASVRSRNQ